MQIRGGFFLLLAIGCAGNAFETTFSQPTARKTPQEEFNLRWTGHSEDDVIVHYGRPSDVLELSTGNHVDSYRRDVSYSEARGSSYGSASAYRADSATVYCERRFELDKKTGVVVRAVITGNACDFSR